MPVSREIEIEAPPEEVWEALATEEGRERWLGEPERDIHVEALDFPHRLAWWWASPDEPATRVEFQLVPGTQHRTSTRVIVTESVPSFPLARLAASFALVAA
jgi:uncharacterized protein YndB with AHSA1/START domain